MPNPHPSARISPKELSSNLTRPNLRIIDASWALDGSNRREVYDNEHIEGAQFFDLEAISDRTRDLPHMAPPAEAFANAVGEMGITQDDWVVVYDQFGLFSAARIWWTFKHMGHSNVQVLDGGLPAWKAIGGAVTDRPSKAERAVYRATPSEYWVISQEALKPLIDQPHITILDARPNARFLGLAEEPRNGLRSGHMPGALNLAFAQLIEDGALKTKTQCQAIFDELLIDHDRHIITTCGSGVTAAIISMALYECGYHNVQLFDGSWAQWGRLDSDTCVVTGT